MKKCSNCGHEVKGEFKYCPKCGREIKVSVSNSQELPRKILYIIFGSLTLVVFLVLFFTGVFNQTPEASPKIQIDPVQKGVDLNVLDRIGQMEAQVLKDTSNMAGLLELAHLLNDSGFKEKAIGYYEIYLRKDPKNADVLVDMGVCYYDLRQFDQARQAMKKGLAINPRHQIAYFNLGIVSLGTNQKDSAKYYWKKALAIDPSTEIGKKARELIETN